LSPELSSSMPDSTETLGRDVCAACSIADNGRRQFIRDLIVGAAGLLLAPSLARASTILVESTRAIESRGNLKTYPIPANDSVQIDHDDDVILVRWENAVYAFNLSCPHQNTALRWVDAAKRFQCPKHHSQYTPSGEFITGRATRGMDRLDIKREGNNVVVNIDSMHRQDHDAAGWTDAVVRLT
jgi:nitrite reductase/ring-hydroxylating ferredoxin subunit